jgi:prepilin-type N-terminal cleavage/methylation domain-containing protein
VQRLGQRGDTLVEITIALAILGSVIVGALNLAGTAFRQGVAARERSQAINLLQEQAEALRNHRDSRSWAAFTGSLPPGQFHMARSGATWVPQSGPWTDTAIPEVFRTGTARIYMVVSGAGDTRVINLSAEWVGPGGGNERTSITTRLVNLDGLAPS